MAKIIKLPNGVEAEVVEHAPGEWLGRVPAALEDWDGTGAAEFRLVETEAAWGEQIARTAAQNRLNATRVTADAVKQALVELRQKAPHHRVTLENTAEHLRCDVRTVRNALATAGLRWKEL